MSWGAVIFWAVILAPIGGLALIVLKIAGVL